MFIPNSVQRIGNNAFTSCHSIVNVSIPESVEKIGFFAFYSCNSLDRVFIPRSVDSIGYGAFAHCRILKEIELDSDNPCFKSKDGGCLTIH